MPEDEDDKRDAPASGGNLRESASGLREEPERSPADPAGRRLKNCQNIRTAVGQPHRGAARLKCRHSI